MLFRWKWMYKSCNIFDKSFEEIINSKKAIKIIEGFNNNVLTQELCKHCGFIDKINKN